MLDFMAMYRLRIMEAKVFDFGQLHEYSSPTHELTNK